jgi:hypothetical protein
MAAPSARLQPAAGGRKSPLGPATEPAATSSQRTRWLGAGLLCWLSQSVPAPSEVQAEIEALAARHQGRPMRGATHELRRPGLDPRQASLLRACVRSLAAA